MLPGHFVTLKKSASEVKNDKVKANTKLEPSFNLRMDLDNMLFRELFVVTIASIFKTIITFLGLLNHKDSL